MTRLPRHFTLETCLMIVGGTTKHRKEHNMFGILKTIGDFLLPKAGKILQGKLTNLGLGVTVAGMAYAGIEGGTVFESFHTLLDLGERGWALVLEAKPHAVIIFGGVTALIGWFRRAGRRHAEDPAA